MANNYVITTVTQFKDYITVTGTVNGTPVTVQVYLSVVGNAMASAVAFQNFIFPYMLAAVPPLPVSVPAVSNLTFTL